MRQEIIKAKKFNMPIKLFYYKINGKMYYVVSNILDSSKLSLEDVKNYYHMRWKVEENIKLAKYKFTLGNIKDKNIEDIEARISSISIYIKIIQSICCFFNDNVSYKLNQSKLINCINDQDFLLRLFLKSDKELFTDKFLACFFKLCVKFIKVVLNRHLVCCRKSKTPYSKWYLKYYVLREMLKRRMLIKKILRLIYNLFFNNGKYVFFS